jgi:hypothetical protein
MSARRSILVLVAIAGLATSALVPTSASAAHLGGNSRGSVGHIGGSQRPFTARRQVVDGRVLLNPQPLPPSPPPPRESRTW